MNIATSLRTAVAAALVLGSLGASASERSLALDRTSVWIGGYYPDATLEVNAHTATGTTANGHVDIDAGHSTIGRFRVDFLALGSQGLTFDYYTLDRSRGRRLNAAFAYDDIVFDGDAELDSKFGFSVGSVAWHWWFGGDTDVFGVGLGAAYYKADLRLSGDATEAGQPVRASAYWSESAAAPLLSLGYKHAFSDALRVYVTAMGVRKSGGSLGGHIIDTRVGVEWFPWQNIGIGAEYGGERVHLDRESRRYGGDFDIRLEGPSLFARLRF